MKRHQQSFSVMPRMEAGSAALQAAGCDFDRRTLSDCGFRLNGMHARFNVTF
jgi:hypothetical protein